MKNQAPLGGLDPADLLAQGFADDTLADGAPSSFQPPPVRELAPLFPQFEILDLIGRGGMGAVYKVRQKDLDRIVALKILPPGIGPSPEFSSRFTREAKALAKLNHPGIVTIHEFGQKDGLHYILMEFVDGVNLAQLMQTGRIAPREALAIVPQICDALQYAHDQGIVHRDIKPENILLDRSGRVKVADFGIAKVMAAACDDPMRSGATPAATVQTIAGKIIGTPQYMAPEQIEHPSDVDHRADIYALGVVFYQMLTGELPGRGLQTPSQKLLIDVRLDEIVLKAMEKQPEMRYQTAREFGSVVEGVQAPAAPRPKPARGSFWSWWWVFPCMLPVGLVIGLALGLAWLFVAPKKYQARAIIEIRPVAQSAVAIPGFLADQMQAIRSRPVLVGVSRQLDLPKRWIISEDEAVRRLERMIRIEPIRGTDLLAIKSTHTNPAEAAEICNALAQYHRTTQMDGDAPTVDVIVHEPALSATPPAGWDFRVLILFGAAGALLLSLLLASLLILLLRRWFPETEPVAAAVGAGIPKAADARVDPFAITSFTLGVASLVLWPLGAIPAIVFGHVSRRRIRNNRALTGDGFAIAGLTLGYLFLAAMMALVILFGLWASVIALSMERNRDMTLLAVAEMEPADTAHPMPSDGEEAFFQVEFQGAVRIPGRVWIPEQASLLDALAAAAGWTGNADLRSIRIHIPGAPEAQIHDLEAILRGEAVNPAIAPDSIIEIPER